MKHSLQNIIVLSLFSCYSISLSSGNAVGVPKGEDRRALSFLLQGMSTIASSVYGFFNNDQNYSKIAIRTSNELCDQEKNFLENRRAIIHNAQQAFVDFEFDQKVMPRIAFCFSGGGFRAMIASLGFLKGAQDIGLLDCTSYMTGLSGSTWAIAAWIASKKSLNDYLSQLGNHTYQGLEPIINPVHINKIARKLAQQMVHNQPPSAINLYGDLLANILFSEFADERFNITLKDTHKHCIDGKLPLPIYTAATVNCDPYEWYEFTPFEMGSAYTKTFIDVDGYGRYFKEGMDEGYAPVLSLGYLLGVYGSAFTVNLSDVIRITGANISEKADQMPGPLKNVLNNMLVDLVNGSVNSLRLLPSKLRNISYKLEGHKLSKDKWLTLVDAGIAFNLPFPPLLRKERAIDIIIVYDASADNADFDSLKGAQDYAITHHLRFPDIQYKDLDKSLVRVFKDEKDPRCPVVIYFPMIKNDAYSKTFDPVENSKNGYCNTFNFTYCQENIDELAGLTEFTIKQNKQLIKDTIAYVINRNVEQLENQ